MFCIEMLRLTGSPPHTRGRYLRELVRGNIGGFTPAYAGKMRLHGRLQPESEVHPRIRGEDRFMA